jgi:hypothetical protein
VSARLDRGSWGDGSLGHQHTRNQCAWLLADLAHVWDGDVYYEAIGLAAVLKRPMTDDASEENAACGWLNTHAAQIGATWGWCDGDFGLWPDDSAGDQ